MDDKEILDALISLNNIARLALVDGNIGDNRNSATNVLKVALEERIDFRNKYGMCLEEVDKLTKQIKE